MNQKLFTFILILLASFSTIYADEGGYDAQIDGVYYLFDAQNKTAKVSNNNSAYHSYSGDLVVPEKITWNGNQYTVTSINSYAFSNDLITSISLPASITEIGEYAFSNCKELSSIVIPSNVVNIALGLCRNCTKLSSVTLHNNIKRIENQAFAGCESLLNLVVPNSVQYIASNSFSDVPNIEYTGSLEDPYYNWGARSINGYVENGIVYNNSSKTVLRVCPKTRTADVTIPNTVDSIYHSAFFQCKSIKNITLLDGLISIGADAFNECESLTSISIPNSVRSMGSYAFGSCSSLTDVVIGNGLKKSGIGNGVDEWGYYVFNKCSALKNVTIQNGAVLIGYGAFNECTSIESITLPNSIQEICGGAFNGCSNIKSLSLGTSVTTIGEYAFQYCTGMKIITIPNTVTTIGEYAFYGCWNIVYNGSATGAPWGAKCINGYYDGEILYSDSGRRKVLGCTSDASGEIELPSECTVIGRGAFSGIKNVTKVIVPTECDTIDDSAFSNFAGDVILPNDLTYLGWHSFMNSKHYNNGDNWEENALYMNNYLVEMKNAQEPALMSQKEKQQNADAEIVYNVKDGTRLIGGGAFAYTNYTSVTIPNSVIGMGYGVFQRSDIKKITIPNGISVIEEYSFESSNLQQIVLPASITKIKKNALYCYNLTTIYCAATDVPETSEYAFNEEKQSECMLYVPTNSVSAYKADPIWGKFNIIGIEDFPSGLENALIDSTTFPKKVIRDGQILILRGEKIYTVTGQEVK